MLFLGQRHFENGLTKSLSARWVMWLSSRVRVCLREREKEVYSQIGLTISLQPMINAVWFSFVDGVCFVTRQLCRHVHSLLVFPREFCEHQPLLAFSF